MQHVNDIFGGESDLDRLLQLIVKVVVGDNFPPGYFREQFDKLAGGIGPKKDRILELLSSRWLVDVIGHAEAFKSVSWITVRTGEFRGNAQVTLLSRPRFTIREFQWRVQPRC